jgi:hypothetical protein
MPFSTVNCEEIRLILLENKTRLRRRKDETQSDETDKKEDNNKSGIPLE